MSRRITELFLAAAMFAFILLFPSAQASAAQDGIANLNVNCLYQPQDGRADAIATISFKNTSDDYESYTAEITYGDPSNPIATDRQQLLALQPGEAGKTTVRVTADSSADQTTHEIPCRVVILDGDFDVVGEWPAR